MIMMILKYKKVWWACKKCNSLLSYCHSDDKIENTFEEMNTNIGQGYNETFGKISKDVNDFNDKVQETFKRVFKIKIWKSIGFLIKQI